MFPIHGLDLNSKAFLTDGLRRINRTQNAVRPYIESDSKRVFVASSKSGSVLARDFLNLVAYADAVRCGKRKPWKHSWGSQRRQRCGEHYIHYVKRDGSVEVGCCRFTFAELVRGALAIMDFNAQNARP